MYIIPPACFLPRYYNNQAKLMELCGNGLPPVTYVSPNLIAAHSFLVSGDRYAGESLDELKTKIEQIITLYHDSHLEMLTKFTQANIQTLEPISGRCLTILYLHSVECAVENESLLEIVGSLITRLSKIQSDPVIMSLLPSKSTETADIGDSVLYRITDMPQPGQKYALQAYKYMKDSGIQSTELADQFLSEYHIQVLHELRGAEVSIPILNALNPMAHPNEQKALIETLRSCLADEKCENSCLDWEGYYREDVFECISKMSSSTCVDG